MNKIFGTKLVFVAGSCNSRWRPAAILKYGFARSSFKNHFIVLKLSTYFQFYGISRYLNVGNCSFYRSLAFQNGNCRPF